MPEAQGIDFPQRFQAILERLGDWRAQRLALVRELVTGADPAITETIKWVKPGNPLGVPVWECGGVLCTGESYGSYLKLTFPEGAALPDPAALFNAGLGGNKRRAIDIFQDSQLDAAAFGDLVRAAIALNARRQPASKRR